MDGQFSALMTNRSILRRIEITGCCALAAFINVQIANAAPRNEQPPRYHDEIIVCGERFRTGGAPIVLWTDKGGYDFHYTKAKLGTPEARKPARVRNSPLTDEKIAEVKRDGWTPEFLRENVDQFVIHYSVDPTSRDTFNTLVKRHLSVQFMLDLDGTLYQTMDLQEEAPHATKANGRSVGIEIANLGARSAADVGQLNEWYKKDAGGKVTIVVPPKFNGGGIRTKNFHGQPARPELVKGIVQGKEYQQYDLTPQQYNSLIRLTATLCTVFPKITADYPRQKPAFGPPTPGLVKDGPASHPDALATLNDPGVLIPHALTDEQYEAYQGVLGHYHVQTDKQDPGPAFQWDYVITSAKKLMTPQAIAANAAARGKPARFIPSHPAPKK
jgi:N-acetyl-anhydromuramyl-L-alanine amidase AmpD